MSSTLPPRHTVVAPQLGVNDEQATLVQWLVEDGCEISRGDSIYVGNNKGDLRGRK